MKNTTENFEKLHSLIGDTTNMSYEEYLGKMFEASIKISSKSEEVDLKKLIDMKEVAEQLIIERAWEFNWYISYITTMILLHPAINHAHPLDDLNNKSDDIST